MKTVRLIIFFVLVACVLVGIAYRFVWPTTPPWLDLTVYGIAGAALLILLAFGGTKK